MKRVPLFVLIFLFETCFAQKQIVDYKYFNGALTNNLKTFKQLKNLFNEKLYDIKLTDFKSINKLNSINLIDKKISIYEVSLRSINIPSVISCKFSLLKNGNHLSILWLEDIKVLKVKDNSNFIGGLYKIRSKGFFAIYSIERNNYKLVFNSASEEICTNGLPIYNSSLDCISYSPFLWKFSQNDYNKDGFMDFSFSGNINYYCKGLEFGIGRGDTKPKNTKKIKLIFLFDKLKNNWHCSVPKSLIFS